MNNLRRLVVTLCLTSFLAVTALAGETSGPPCNLDPGITPAPPCATAPATDDTTDPGEQNGPPASDTTDYVVSFVEETLLQFLMF